MSEQADEWIKGKSPSYPYYPSDWLNDPALQSCSLYARGLWHEMNSRMWACEPQGHLVLNGKPYTLPQLARFVREPEKQVKAALEELEAAGVYSKTPEGVIYSRRMVRDVHNRKVRAEGGKKGGNPELVGKGKGGRKVGGKVNLPETLHPEGEDNQKPTLSSSSSFSRETGDKSPALCAESAPGGMSDFERREVAACPSSWGEALRGVWLRWLRHLTELLRGRPSTEMLRKHWDALRPLPDDAARIAWLECAMERGLRAPAEPRNGAKKTEVIAGATDAERDEKHAKGF